MIPLIKGRWAQQLTAFFLASAVLLAHVAPRPVAAQTQAAPDPCASCHGAGGNSTTPGIPSIAGQPQLFLENQLILFREGLRRSEAMEPVVKGMKDAEIVVLAKRFAALPPKRATQSAPDPALARTGRALAKKLHCGSCHVPDFRGQNQIPRLAGQREEYLVAEMRAYRDGKRTGGDTIMSSVLYGVTDGEIDALAHFLAHLPPSSRARR